MVGGVCRRRRRHSEVRRRQTRCGERMGVASRGVGSGVHRCGSRDSGVVLQSGERMGLTTQPLGLARLRLEVHGRCRWHLRLDSEWMGGGRCCRSGGGGHGWVESGQWRVGVGGGDVRQHLSSPICDWLVHG